MQVCKQVTFPNCCYDHYIKDIRWLCAVLGATVRLHCQMTHISLLDRCVAQFRLARFNVAGPTKKTTLTNEALFLSCAHTRTHGISQLCCFFGAPKKVIKQLTTVRRRRARAAAHTHTHKTSISMCAATYNRTAQKHNGTKQIKQQQRATENMLSLLMQ